MFPFSGLTYSFIRQAFSSRSITSAAFPYAFATILLSIVLTHPNKMDSISGRGFSSQVACVIIFILL